MNSINTLSLILTTTLPVVVLSQHYHGGQEEYKPSKNSPDDDPGHNAHQETLIFACLGAVVVMAILIIILLWFFVDRTKDTVRLIERLLPDIIEWMKSEEDGGTGPGHLSGTFDAKNEFEAGFKGSVDFIDATGDRVKLTSYSKKEDTVTTIVDDTVGSTGLTSYTKKLNNGDMPRYQNDKAATRLPTYTKMDHQQVRSAVEIDGPMSARQTTSTTQITADVSVVQAKAQPIRSGLSGGGYLSATPSPHVTAYSPDHISGHAANPPSRVTTRHDGHNRRRQKHTHSVSNSPPVTPTDPEKAALRNGGEVILAYWEPPAYTAYDNQALSIDKRATLPVTTPPCSPEGKDNGSEEDISLKKKRRASFYVESHV